MDGAQRGVSELREAPDPAPRAAPEPPDIGSPLSPRDIRGTGTRSHGDGRAPHPRAPPGPKSSPPNLQKRGAAPASPQVPPTRPSPLPSAEPPHPHPRFHVGGGRPTSTPAPHPPPLPDRAAASAECSRAEGRRCACLPARALPPAHPAQGGAPCSPPPPPPPRAPPPSAPRDLHPNPDPLPEDLTPTGVQLRWETKAGAAASLFGTAGSPGGVTGKGGFL